MNGYTGAKIYSSVGMESGAISADPHKLILMLYEGALLAISSARNQMLRKEISAKGASISKAISIIDEGLKASLNVKSGGQLAQNLSDLYDYMNQRLLIANLKNDITVLDEVTGLLTEIQGAWKAIRPSAQQGAAVQPQTAPMKQAALTYGRM